MTLRIKTLFIGGTTLIALIGVLYAVSAKFLLTGFSLIEKQETTEGVERAKNDFDNAMVRLDDTIAGWGQWDESVRFVRTNDTKTYNQYVTANLNDGILPQFKSDLIIYVRGDDRLIYGTGFNRQSRRKEPLAKDIWPHLKNQPKLLHHRNPQTGVRGILMVKKGPLLVVSRPIVNDAGEGPIYGSLVCGRFLTNVEIQAISQAMHLPITAYRLDTPQLPEDFQKAYLHLSSKNAAQTNSNSNAIYTKPLDEHNVAGYTVVEDINGQPALLLRVETKRDIYEQGLISLRFVLLALLSIGLIGGGLALWALEHWVLARLSRLSQGVGAISTSGDISTRVPVAGRDELSKLAESINQLLATAHNAQNELRIEILERRKAEQALLQSRDELEMRVIERTDLYVQANTQLQGELIERERAEETLRQAQEKLQLVINHIPQAIFWKDSNLVFMGSNDRFALNAGYDTPQELVGLDDFAISGENANAYRADDMEVIESDCPKLNIEERLKKADGNTIWLRTNKIPLHDRSGAVVGILGSYEDVTQQKSAEEALQLAREEADKANSAKSEFLSRMSHELRTPLNAILGFGQILESQSLSPIQKESVGYILKGGRHLLGLINEILDMARVEAGHIELAIETVSVSTTVAEACALMRPIAAKHGIGINDNVSALANHYVLADQRRLKQVFINLLSNAIKYNSVEGRVIVEVSRPSQGTVVVSVRDTGPGIANGNQDRIFTPFERLGAGTSDVEGTGLGLALSKKLMLAMQGDLKFESVLGQGSIFSAELPEAASPATMREELPQQDSERQEISSSSHKHTLLYIEDNPSNLRLMEVLLEGRGDIELLSATHGTSGLQMAHQYLPDLILLDLNLPGMHGKDVLAELQKSTLTRDIPVVIISADATASQRESVSSAKAFLSKPLDVSKFFCTIDEMLETDEKASA